MREVYLNKYCGLEHHISQTSVPFPQAQFAMDMMKVLAVATGYPDGESSDGRSKLRLMTPQEVVERCVEIAERSFAAFAEKQWLLAVPGPMPEEITPEEAKALMDAGRLDIQRKTEAALTRIREHRELQEA